MIVLDTTIINVALPSISADLGFSEVSLVWVVNAYLLTFGGSYCSAVGWAISSASVGSFCSGPRSSRSHPSDVGFRVHRDCSLVRGPRRAWGGAVVSAVALSLTMILFTEPRDRAKAIGIYSFVTAGGGSLGLLFGGTLTSALNWHWIFLVNLPIGALVYLLGFALLLDRSERARAGRLDIAGAATVTISPMLAVYAIVNGNEADWTSLRRFYCLPAQPYS
jgi:MFS family permease